MIPDNLNVAVMVGHGFSGVPVRHRARPQTYPQAPSNNGASFTLPRPLIFINTSNPSEVKEPSNRYLVRSFALRNYKARRKQRCNISPQSGLLGHHLEYKNEIKQHLVRPHPKSILGAGRVDPFLAYPRNLSSHEHHLLDYFVTKFCPQNDKLYATEFSAALTTIWLPEAIKHEGLLDGILLISGRDLMEIAPSKELENLILQLRGRLIQDVKAVIGDRRKAVMDESIGTLIELAYDEVRVDKFIPSVSLSHSSELGDATILISSCGCLEQLATGNLKDLATHCKGLESIIRSRTDLVATGFQGFMIYLMSRINLVAALHQSLETPNPHQRYSPHTTSPNPPPRVGHLPPGFLSPLIIRNLSAELATVLHFFAALSNFLSQQPAGLTINSTTSSPTTAASPPPGTFMIEERFSLYETEWQTLSWAHEKFDACIDEPDIRRCVTFAASIYRDHVLYEDRHRSRRSSTSNRQAQPGEEAKEERGKDMENYKRGIERLLRTAEERRDQYLPLVLWMAVMGGLAAAGMEVETQAEAEAATAEKEETTSASAPKMTGEHAMTKTEEIEVQTGEMKQVPNYWPALMRTIADELRFSTWEEVRGVLKRFLWLERRCEGVGRELWRRAGGR